MLQSKCLRLATGAPWYVSNRQIHEDLGVPLFALTASFDSKLADVGNPFVLQLRRYADRGLTPSPDAKVKGGRGQPASRGHRPRWPSRLNESRSALISRAPFGYPDRFSVIFLSCNANARVYDRKLGHGPHSPTARRVGFTYAPERCRFCDSAILGSEPGEPTKQSLSLPQLEYCQLGAKLWQDQSTPSA